MDQEDKIYLLKNIQENMLNNVILKGIKDIPKIIIRKVTNKLKHKETNYLTETSWVLDTVGSNLLDTLSLENIDVTKTVSNDIQEEFLMY